MFKKTDILFYKEALSLSFVIAISLAIIVIIIKLASFTDLLFASSNIFATLSLLFLYLLPPILTILLPIGIFTSCALIATRMAADREMDALFSSGMSFNRVLLPPFVFGIVAMMLMLWNSFYYEPYSREQFKFFKWFQARQIVESFILNNLHEKSFISDFPLSEKNKVVFYADSISKPNVFSDIFIAFENQNANTKNVFVAKKGNFAKTFSDGYPDFIFTLSDGTIYSEDKTITQFGKINFSLLNAFSEKFKADDIQNTTQKPNLLNDLKSVSAAVCTLFFPALGMCLGLLNTHNKPFRVYIGIGFVTILFYALLSFGRMSITRFDISPYIAYSIPPFIFGILTILMVKERQKIK